MANTIELEQIMELKGGENSHLKAELHASVNPIDGKPYRPNIYGPEFDRGAKVRLKGWTNIGDISAALRTSTGLGELYKNTETPHVAVASKHTRPVVIAVGKTQLEAVTRAIAGDVNSPFGGIWGLNTPLDVETAKFIDKMFIEGIVAPEYEEGTAELLQDTSKVKAHANRFLVETGPISMSDIDCYNRSVVQVAMGYFLRQDREPAFDARTNCVVVTGGNGNPDINSVDDAIVNDIQFAGNAAVYLNSNLVFFVQNGAIAGLGDGCGARTVAATKARSMFESSVYAALSAKNDKVWDLVLYDTPFTREDFEAIDEPLKLTAFSDAFYPKLDGFIETAGLDRINEDFGARQVNYEEKEDGKMVGKTFIPKRNNFDPEYDRGLIPAVVVQPGGCLGDKLVVPMAEKYGVKMIFTMTPDQFETYQAGKRATGRRFFGHMPMS